MSKKKEIKQIFENLDVEATEAHPQKSELAREAAQQTSIPNADQSEDETVNLRAEMLAAEQTETPVQESGAENSVEDGEQAAHAGSQSSLPADQDAAQQGLQPGEPQTAGDEEESSDNILDDVRKSLLEEEAREEEHPKWWKRIGRSSHKKEAEEAARQPEEINMPSLSAMAAVDAQAETQPEDETHEYQEQLDELIDLLDKEDAEEAAKGLMLAQAEVPAAQGAEPEPEKPVDIEDLKKQAFQARPEEETNDNLTEVRSIALEGDEEVFVEVESKKQAPLEERLDAVENALKPYQRYISFGLAFVGLVLAIAAAFLIYNVYQRSVAQNAAATAVVQSNLPYPTSVQLPGGWSFNLGKGALQEGQWNPKGAEWLQGTEVCRWVALPWSRQLEAVVRTLNPKDPVELGMSNNDRLTYSVYSIQQMSPEEMRQLDSNKPCLLIVLAEPDAQKRWVLTSLP